MSPRIRLNWFATFGLLALSVFSFLNGLLVNGVIAGIGSLGSALNLLVFHANGNKMPVFLPESRWSDNSPYHKLGTKTDRFKLLADHFRFGRSVFSIGDVLVTLAGVVLAARFIWRVVTSDW